MPVGPVCTQAAIYNQNKLKQFIKIEISNRTLYSHDDIENNSIKTKIVSGRNPELGNSIAVF